MGCIVFIFDYLMCLFEFVEGLLVVIGYNGCGVIIGMVVGKVFVDYLLSGE